VTYSEDKPRGLFYPHALMEKLTLPLFSVIRVGNRNLSDGNEKMAMLGDTVLQLVIVCD